MSNTIKIKRGNGAPTSLADGELGWDKTNKALYIGDDSAPYELFRKTLLDMVYPIGSIYMSMSATSPASFLGGTWEQLQSRFLYGADSSYASGATGGASTHTLTVNEMPSHNHTGSSASAGAHTHTATTNSSGAHTHSGTAGSAGNHYHAGPSGRYFLYHYTSKPSTGAPSGSWSSGGGLMYYGDETAYAGSHTHTITASSAGAHTHTLTTASSDAHTHTITVSAKGGGGGLLNDAAVFGSLYVETYHGYVKRAIGNLKNSKSVVHLRRRFA